MAVASTIVSPETVAMIKELNRRRAEDIKIVADRIIAEHRPAFDWLATR